MQGLVMRHYFGFVWPHCSVSSAIASLARRSAAGVIFDVTRKNLLEIAKKLIKCDLPQGQFDLKLCVEDLTSPDLPLLLEDTTVRNLWIEIGPHHEVDILSAVVEASRKFNGKATCIPVLSSLKIISHLLDHVPELPDIALKGNEAAGFVGPETALSLICAVRSRLAQLERSMNVFLWGGIGTPEAAAGMLIMGVKGIVFESLHWLTELSGFSQSMRERIRKLRPEHTEIVGTSLGVPVRLYNKGNSVVVKNLRALSQRLLTNGDRAEAQRAFVAEVERLIVPPIESTVGSDEVVPIGVEASFASLFARRFGDDTEAAVEAFLKSVCDHYVKALSWRDRLKDCAAAKTLGTRYPIIQGAMSWITDEPQFALKVAEAGALPTIALGVLDPETIQTRFCALRDAMRGFAFAINVVTLPDNPHRQFHFDWILKTRPNYVVIAAGDPSHALRFLAEGIDVIYVTPSTDLMKLAFDLGVKFVVCEGNEAGGHVGANSTLTLAQTVLALRYTSPALFKDKTVILAGGIYDRDTAFLASVLGADAIQIGTAYLATKEIVSTGALAPLYQKKILGALPGETVVTGESIGLRIRSLATPKIQSLLELERDFLAGREGEEGFRRKLEALTAGSLFVAAKGCDIAHKELMPEEACLSEGQFMSGTVAGFLKQTVTLDILHEELVSGPTQVEKPDIIDVSREVGFSHGGKYMEDFQESFRGVRIAHGSASVNKPERIAITGMSVANSLGSSCEEVLTASLAKRSGITRVPRSRWDHSIYFDPRPRIPEKTYCDIGAFMQLDISRRDIGAAPHDFRTMTGATRLTMLLADQAIRESGILDSDIPRERISVLISQNSGEAAGTLQDMIVRGSTDAIVKAVTRVLNLEPHKLRELEDEIKRGRLAVDDTTLLGRLNCSAGGFICNKYGFMGPTFAVSAACATSLVALYTAIQFIRNGIIDAAVVGGGEEFLSPMHFMEFSALGALAGISGAHRQPSEASRPFDRHRDGMVLGEGGGMLVIEKESVARKRGAKIYALITSVGASNNNLGMVESSSQTQELAIKASFTGLDYGPEDIDFIECHATGTRQGDIEEVRALGKFFKRDNGGVVLSSFKSQIGHTLGASGINSLIRGVMAMNAGVFPPTVNCLEPDKELELEKSGMVLLREPEEWKKKDRRPRRMQVNAFGFGGSNYVVQLEQSLNGEDMVLVDLDTNRPSMSPVSNGQYEALDSVEGLMFFEGVLSGEPYRVAVLADNEDEARRLIDESDVLKNGPTVASKRIRSLAKQGIHLAPRCDLPEHLAFVFPGQGSHYAGMGRELYETFPVIRMWMDHASDIADFDLLHLLFHDREEDLQKTRWQQPALFTLEYALAKCLLSFGAKPTALAGHSLGELTALCLAGVYSFEDGFRLVNKRALCMDKACSQGMDPGIMLACDAPREVLDQIMKRYPNTFVTNLNSPKQIVVGGGTDAVQALGSELKGRGFRSTLLRVSMAFHSPIMRCIRDELEEFVSPIPFYPPQIPVISNTTGEPFPNDPSRIKAILMDHLESPVLWMQDIKVLSEDFGIKCFLEVGPREVLSNLIKDTVEQAECIQTCLPSAEPLVFKTALARLYARGYLKTAKPPLSLNHMGTPSQSSSVGEPKVFSPPIPLYPDGGQLQAIVQKHINRFVLESFGRFLKPEILQTIREHIDPTYSEERLESFLSETYLAGEVKNHAALAMPKERLTSKDSSTHDRFPESDGLQTVASTSPLDQADVTERVISLIMEATGYERNEIEPDMDLREDLSIRSSRLPVIMDAVESHFGIKIQLEDFIDVRTIKDIANRISAVMAVQDNKLGEGTYASTSDKILAKTENADQRRQSIKRVVFRETSAETTNLNPIEMTATDPILILSARSGTGLRRSIGDVFRRDYGATILTGKFLAEEEEQELFAVDLRIEDHMARAVTAINNMMQEPTGLVVVLDESVEDKIRDIHEVSIILSGLFAIVKAFLQSPSKKFVLVVEKGTQDASAHMLMLKQGLLGVLLSASLELGYVLFRSITVQEGVNLTKAIRWALNREVKPVDLLCTADGLFTTEGQLAPLVVLDGARLSLTPSDVIVFSGGGYGITSILAKSLALLFGCKIVLLGRTEIDDQRSAFVTEDHPSLVETTVNSDQSSCKSSTEASATGEKDPLCTAKRVIETLRDLQSRGIEASYYSCDVTDPSAVRSVFSEIYQKYGHIDGIVHGAGILKDNLIKSMNLTDFREVIDTKFLGAWHFYNALGDRPIKFFACLSSAASIQGNPGQSNYAAANRMMSSLMSYFLHERPETIFKSFMLPPIEGLGMADNPEIRAIMRRAQTEYIHVDELTEIFWRELLHSPHQDVWVLYMRSLPELKTAPIRLVRGHENKEMLTVQYLAFPRYNFPLIDQVDKLDLKQGYLRAVRSFSTDRDLWIDDHRPFAFLKHPILSGIMVIEAMLEACRILHPTLKVISAKDVWFFDVIECPPHTDQEVIIECSTIDRSLGEVSCEVQLFTTLQKHSEQIPRPHPHYRGTFIMEPTNPCYVRDEGDELQFAKANLTKPISRESILAQYELRSGMKDRYRVIDSVEGLGPGTIRATTTYRYSVDFSDRPTSYHYSPYLLEALMQSASFYLVGRGDSTNAVIIPYRIEDLFSTRTCHDGEVIVIEGRLLEENKDGIEWGARAVDENGETIMHVKSITFRWFTLPQTIELKEDA